MTKNYISLNKLILSTRWLLGVKKPPLVILKLLCCVKKLSPSANVVKGAQANMNNACSCIVSVVGGARLQAVIGNHFWQNPNLI